MLTQFNFAEFKVLSPEDQEAVIKRLQDLVNVPHEVVTAPRPLETVGELIDHLETLGRDRPLIVDVYGNTFPPTTEDINLWDPDTEDGPVAIFIKGWIDDSSWVQ